MVIKIDFEKVYDHVDWNFLNFVLEAKDFGGKIEGLSSIYELFSFQQWPP